MYIVLLLLYIHSFANLIAICMFLFLVFPHCKYLTAKQETSYVVSLLQSPLTFVWPGVPKDCWMELIGAPSEGDRNAIWWDENVPSYVVAQLNIHKFDQFETELNIIIAIVQKLWDQTVIWSKWCTHGEVNLAKGQLGHCYTLFEPKTK